MSNATTPTAVKRASFSAEHLGMKELDADFKPAENDVICARGKEVYNHEGNRRFRALVKKHLNTYSSCVTKMQKSRLVNYIVGTVREASPNGGFVKKIDQRWYAVTDRHAREKAGQTMRDLLHNRYSSSTKAKARNRQCLRAARNYFSGRSNQLEDEDSLNGHHRASTKTTFQRALSSAPTPLRAFSLSPSTSCLRRSNCVGGDHSTMAWAASQLRSELALAETQSEPPLSPFLDYNVSSSCRSAMPTLRCATSGPVTSSRTALMSVSRFNHLFEDPSEDFSMGMDESLRLEDLDPLPLDESSTSEFNFDGSSNTLVSEASFSEAVDTLFDCLHIQ